MYRIITDTSANLELELLERKGIAEIPFSFSMPEKGGDALSTLEKGRKQGVFDKKTARHLKACVLADGTVVDMNGNVIGQVEPPADMLRMPWLKMLARLLLRVTTMVSSSPT